MKIDASDIDITSEKFQEMLALLIESGEGGVACAAKNVLAWHHNQTEFRTIYPAVLIQGQHLSDGIYRFDCGVCGKTLPVAYTPLTMIVQFEAGIFPGDYPVKYCWHCGIRFTHYRILK